MDRWIDIFVGWFPMLLLIGVWIFFMQRMRSGKGWGIQAQYLEEMRRHNERLEQILSRMDERVATLEKQPKP